MEMVWLITGFIVGVVAVWAYFNAWFKRQVSAREAGWANACSKTQETADLERDAHRKTEKRLSALEAKHIIAIDQTVSLSAEVNTLRERLDGQRRRLMKAKQLQSQAESDRSAVAEWADALRLELETARFRLSKHENPFPKNGSAPLAQLPVTTENPRNWLKMERWAAIQSETQIAAPAAPSRVPMASAQESAPVVENTDDNLTWLKGMKGKLNQVGITSFSQISGFPEADIAQADETPEVCDRIRRKRRVEPAQIEPPEELVG